MVNPDPTLDQLLQSAIQHHQLGRLAQAEAIYRQILRHNPRHADALHLLGVIAHQAGRHDVAVNLIRQAIALQPNYPQAYSNLGDALTDLGRLDEAIAACRAAIALQPGYPAPWNNLANALTAKGQVDEAIAACRHAIALKPDYPQAHCNLGDALCDRGKVDEAIAEYRQAIALNPNYPQAHCNLGSAMYQQRRLDEAIAAYRKAISLKGDYAQAHSNLGVALRDRGRLDEAIAEYHRAIALKPDLADAHSNLGVALNDQRRFDQAIAACRAAIALKPGHFEAYGNLGIVLYDQGRVDQAIAAFRTAIALNGAYPLAHNNLGNALKEAGQVDDAIAAYRQAIILKPDFTQAHSNLLYALHLHPRYDAQGIAEELEHWNRRHAQPLTSCMPHTNDRDPQRRLRIGYVSPDFLDHPVGQFLFPLLSHHDKSQVEVFAYAQQVSADAMTHRLRSCTDGWRNIFGLSDSQVTDLIRQDQIDILIDLTVHAASNRLFVFARKPAPVQVTYLAYCSSTGLQTIDYRLSDPYLDPPGTDESIYSERTVRLPETYWCYQPSAAAPEVGDGPASTQGFITFGCLNNFCKVSEPALAVWARILRATENSQLLLYAHEGAHRERVRERFERAGIDRGRVRFVARSPVPDYLRTYNQIDIGLDPFPYCGGTTTCDALWMGVPVVSLSGKTAVGRGGLSILSNIRLPELVAQTQEQYLQIAGELAADLPRLSALRSTLRQRMEQSPLMDAPRFARNIEAAYRHMWRQWCAGSTTPE